MNQKKLGNEPSNSLYFYHQDSLATQLKGGSARSVFRTENCLSAQLRREQSAMQAAMMTTDAKDTVLVASVSGEPHCLAYTPYGFNQESSDLPGLPGFNGETRDAVTGHYLLGSGYRLYNPVLMRFQSADSWSPFGEGGLNGYAYLSCDPVNYSDPTGHMFRRTKSSEVIKKPSLKLAPASNSAPASRVPSVSRSISQSSRSSLLTPPSTPSAASSRDSWSMSDSSVFSSGLSDKSEGWKLDKSQAKFKSSGLTKAEQRSFDIFQNAIYHGGLSPEKAVTLLGSGADYKAINKKLGIYQFRLSGGERVHIKLEEKTVNIRQVGGHT